MLDIFDPILDQYLNLELDSDGVILHFESDMECFKSNSENLIGLNWFDTFIPISDRDKITEIYRTIFDSKLESDLNFSYDISTFQHKHLYMSFEHCIKYKDNRRILRLMGREYHLNKNYSYAYLHCIKVVENIYHLE